MVGIYHATVSASRSNRRASPVPVESCTIMPKSRFTIDRKYLQAPWWWKTQKEHQQPSLHRLTQLSGLSKGSRSKNNVT
jgi:hypothetical protein